MSLLFLIIEWLHNIIYCPRSRNIRKMDDFGTEWFCNCTTFKTILFLQYHTTYAGANQKIPRKISDPHALGPNNASSCWKIIEKSSSNKTRTDPIHDYLGRYINDSIMLSCRYIYIYIYIYIALHWWGPKGRNCTVCS